MTFDTAITQGYIDANGEPLKCCHCNSSNLKDTITGSIDVGVGPGYPCEIQIQCLQCEKEVAYWAYGDWRYGLEIEGKSAEQEDPTASHNDSGLPF